MTAGYLAPAPPAARAVPAWGRLGLQVQHGENQSWPLISSLSASIAIYQTPSTNQPSSHVANLPTTLSATSICRPRKHHTTHTRGWEEQRPTTIHPTSQPITHLHKQQSLPLTTSQARPRTTSMASGSDYARDGPQSRCVAQVRPQPTAITCYWLAAIVWTGVPREDAATCCVSATSSEARSSSPLHVTATL